MVAIVGVMTRVWLLATPAGLLNSDEAVTGLGAIEALHGRFDVVVPGNAYTATLESFLFAPFAAVFGGRILLLKLMGTVLWAVGCLLVYRLIRRSVSELAGLLAASVAWLVPGAFLELSTRAYLAYPGGFVLAAGALATLMALAASAVPSRRSSMMAGLLCGLAVYAHPMYLAVLVPAVVVVGVHHAGRWRDWWLPCGIVAFVVNLPFLVWNVRHGNPSLREDLADESRGTYLTRLGRFFSGLIPRDFGLRDYPGTRWTFGRLTSSLVAAALIAAMVYGGIRLFRAGRAGRLLAITAVAVWPLMAVFSALGFVLDGRYGVVPAVPMFACLGVAAEAAVLRIGRIRAGSTPTFGAACVIGLWLVGLVGPSMWRITGVTWGNGNADYGAVVDRLDRAGIAHVAGNYWAVLPITYVTNGRIPSAVSAPDPIRYPLYQRATQAMPPNKVGFVFRNWNENPAVLYLKPDCYDREAVGQLVLYLPKAVC